ncbi:HNH endonuclease [Pedobacter sp. BS3]|uniref:HNH endonuclease n=1 Tax=Pedobacter sp. BS3 TaxID=2567937 RepID=UPI0011EFBBD3|nr:HNH endonuclease [Pedobacter sp. BS3]TZF84544.1 HNH endonuclease [Pedobacter sp. BS3]
MNFQNSNQFQPKYKFYATLLDSFHYYLNNEYSTFQEFIDKINRVPFISEKAEKGTAFNNLVDLVAAGKIQSLYDDGLLSERIVRNNQVIRYIHTSNDGGTWMFDFKPAVVFAFAEAYKNAIPQLRTVGYLDTPLGLVELYGNLDELEGDIVTDIKTTDKYDFPKFLHNYQHLVYPFTLNQQGIPVTKFRYHITDFSNIYVEEYVYNPERDIERLKSHCMHLINFLEMHRHLITDKKVFAMDQQEEAING